MLNIFFQNIYVYFFLITHEKKNNKRCHSIWQYYQRERVIVTDIDIRGNNVLRAIIIGHCGFIYEL